MPPRRGFRPGKPRKRPIVPIVAAASHADLSLEELIARGEAAQERMDVDEAANWYQAALRVAPDDVRVLGAYAEVLISMGNDEAARDVLLRVVTLAPNGSFEAYTYLAQMSEGAEAVRAYAKAAELLQARLTASASGAAAPDGSSPSVLRRQLSSVYASLSETYMTDLCDEPEAEEACEKYASLAVEADPSNPEAYATMANCRMCRSRPLDAPPLLRRAVELIDAAFAALDDVADEAMADQDAMDEDAPAAAAAPDAAAVRQPSADDEERYALLPAYDYRMGLARTCMEAEVYDGAITLLDRLIAQDDANMEAWYLIGEALLLSGDPEGALERLTSADEMLDAAVTRAKSASSRAGKGKKISSPMPMDSFNEGLNALDLKELVSQQTMIRKLLTVVRERLGTSSDAAAAGAMDETH